MNDSNDSLALNDNYDEIVFEKKITDEKKIKYIFFFVIFFCFDAAFISLVFKFLIIA